MESSLVANLVVHRHSWQLFLFLIVISILYAVLFGYFSEQSKQILAAAVKTQSRGLLERADSEMMKKVGKYMNLLFFSNVLLFIHALINHYGFFAQATTGEYLLLFSIVIGVFAIKYLFHRFLGTLFKTEQETFLFLENLYLKYKLYGVFVFPIILTVLFSNTFAQVAVIVGILGFFIMWIISTLFALRLGLMLKSFPKYYSFLYICTLEILPLALAVQIFREPLTSLWSI